MDLNEHNTTVCNPSKMTLIRRVYSMCMGGVGWGNVCVRDITAGQCARLNFFQAYNFYCIKQHHIILSQCLI